MISVTGNPFQQGFTLLEIMIVIVIIAGFSSLVMLSFALSSNNTELETTFQQFRIQAQLLSRKAMAEQRWMGLRFSDNQFQAMVFTDKGWRTLDNEGVAWLAPLNVELFINSQPINLLTEAKTPQLQFSPEGLNSSFYFRVSEQNLVFELEGPYDKVR